MFALSSESTFLALCWLTGASIEPHLVHAELIPYVGWIMGFEIIKQQCSGVFR